MDRNNEFYSCGISLMLPTPPNFPLDRPSQGIIVLMAGSREKAVDMETALAGLSIKTLLNIRRNGDGNASISCILLAKKVPGAPYKVLAAACSDFEECLPEIEALIQAFSRGEYIAVMLGYEAERNSKRIRIRRIWQVFLNAASNHATLAFRALIDFECDTMPSSRHM